MNPRIFYSLLAVVLAITFGVSGYYFLPSDSPTRLEESSQAMISNMGTSLSAGLQKKADDNLYDRQLREITRSLREMQNELGRFKNNLNAEMRALKQSISAGQSDPFLTDTNSLLPKENVDDDISEDDKEIAAIAWYENQSNAIEAVLNMEEPDQQWASETEQRFLSAFDQNSSSMELHSLFCGDSVCKVNAAISVEGSSTDLDIDHLVYGDIEWEGPMLSSVNADTGEVIIYLVRPGMELPTADSEG